MRLEVLRPAIVEVDAVRLIVHIRYDDDQEALADCPGVSGKTLGLTIGLDDGVVHNWPDGRTADIHLKVVDNGHYSLMSRDEVVAVRDDYVPSFFPGEHYGDYVILNIDSTGKVAGWCPRAGDVAEAFRLGGDE